MKAENSQMSFLISLIERNFISIKNVINQTNDIGLWKGKMGLAIYLFHLARITKNDIYEKEANSLIDEVIEKVDHQVGINFSSGLAGIGAGFEYLAQHNFIEGDTDIILSEFDRLFGNSIYYRKLNNPGVSNGICGLGYYLYLRLNTKTEDNTNLRTLKNRLRMIRIIDWLEDSIPTASNQELYDSYLLLLKVHSLDLMNYKVEKLMNVCTEKLSLFDAVSDNYEGLGIPSLKILLPWM